MKVELVGGPLCGEQHHVAEGTTELVFAGNPPVSLGTAIAIESATVPRHVYRRRVEPSEAIPARFDYDYPGRVGVGGGV